MTDATPSKTFLLGAYPAMGIDRFETEIGHKIALVKHYNKFPEFPFGLSDDIAAGRVPLVMWSSNLVGGASATAKDIIAGRYDAQIVKQAAAVKAINGRILIEWEPEMTGNPRNPLFFAGLAEDEYGPFYVAVWMHIQQIFDDAGALNAELVWSPGGNAFLPHHKSAMVPCEPYFPGADNVDWMGLHHYQSTPENFADDADVKAWYDLAQQWASDVPLIVSETGASNTDVTQAQWIESARTDIPTEFPLVRGFVLFNANVNGAWSLAGKGLEAFSAMAGDAYFSQAASGATQGLASVARPADEA